MRTSIARGRTSVTGWQMQRQRPSRFLLAFIFLQENMRKELQPPRRKQRATPETNLVSSRIDVCDWTVVTGRLNNPKRLIDIYSGWARTFTLASYAATRSS